MPLTVSPFVSLPTAATLPYTYKTMPSTLPPPISGVTGANNADQKPKYVVAPSGHAAHPSDIVASCEALRSHIAAMQDKSERALKEMEERIQRGDVRKERAEAFNAMCDIAYDRAKKVAGAATRSPPS